MYLVITEGCGEFDYFYFETLDDMLKKYKVDCIDSLLEKSNPFCIYTVYKIEDVWKYDD